MAKLSQNKTVNNILRALSIAVICIAATIGVVFFKANTALIAGMMGYMVVYVLLPGAFFVYRLGCKGEYISTLLVRSFFTGFAFNVILYFFANLIGSDLLLWISGPAFSTVFCVRYLRGASVKSSLRRIVRAYNAPASLYIFAACVFIYSIISTQYTYISPAHSDYSFLKIDYAYHAGIINSLSQSFPPTDPWISGRIIEYHYFTEMLYSIPVRLFGFASEEILMSFTPYIITPVLSLSMYSFFKEFSKKREMAGLYCLAAHFSNAFMLKAFAKSWFLFHIYSNINNAGMGISCLLVLLPLLKGMDFSEDRKNNRGETILTFILVMLTTGIKGPIAIVLAGAMIGTTILAAILGKLNKNALAYTGLCVIAFALVYIYILGAQHSNETGGALMNPWEVTDLFFLKAGVMNNLNMPRPVQLIVLLSLFIVFFLTAFLVPFIAGYLREVYLVLTGKKDFVFSKVVIYACCMVGFIAMLLLNFSGHSQVYFGFVTNALVPMVSFWYLEDIRNDMSRKAFLIRTAFGICLCLSAVTIFIYVCGGAEQSYENYLNKNDNDNKYRNVSAAEYEALIWIRQNTDDDALIANDRYYSVPKDEYIAEDRGSNTHFAYAVYSRRNQFIEGTGFSLEKQDSKIREEMISKNSQLFDENNARRGEAARTLGVDYVIVSGRFEDTGDLSNTDYEKCFTNDEVVIYRIKE